MTQVVEVLMEDDDSLLDESSISVQSLVELKGIKRRRVDKLMELLGERPPHELVMVDENLPLTPVQRPLSNDEKKTLQKRVNKIGQMLGEQLPSEVLAAQAQEIRKSTDNLSVLRDRADSSTSIATNASNSYNEAFQSKVVKKKRIDKLIELLGERPPNDLVGLANISDWEIPSSPLITTRPLTIEERKILRTRLNKLEQMLGEQPPSAVVVAQLSEIRKSGENLSSGLSRDRASSDASLISFDYESKDVKRKRFDKLVELLGERPPQDLVARVISEDTSPPISTTLDKPLSLEEKKALRKRINKLGQMLGSTLPSDMMNNQRRLADNVVVKRTMVVERSISESSLASLDNRATSPATKEANHGQIIEEKKQRKYKGKIVGPYDVQERRVKSTPTSPVVSRRSSVSRQDIEQVPIILNQGDDRHHYDNKPRLVPTLILETESGGNLTRSTDSNLSTILSTTSSVIPEKVVMRNQLDKLKSILGERPPQPLLSQPGPRSKAKSKRPKKEATTASARRPFEHESNPPCLQEPENSRPAALVLIEDSNKLSTQEKVSVQRRRSKMEQVFGETPPTHILQHPLTASSGVSSANDQLDNDEASYSDDEVVQVSQKRISQKRHSKLEQMLGEVPSLEEVAHVMNTTSSSEVGVAIEREEEEVAKKQKRLSQRRPSKLGQLFAGMDLIESPKNSGVSAVESNLNEFVDQGNQKSGGQSQMSKRGEATTGNDETNTQESASSTTVATPEESLMLNPQDKRQLQKRRSKLGQMFGEEVHQNALTTNYIARNDHHIDGGVGDDEPIDKDAANIDANNNLHSETKEVRRRQRNKVSEVLGEKPPSVLLLEPAAAGTETDEAGNNTKTTNRLSKIFNIVFFGGISASATTPSVSDSSRIIVVADAVSSEVKVALNASDTGLQRANSSIYSENTPMEDVENFKLSNISKKIDAMLAASDHRSMKSSSSSSSSSKKKSELLQRPTRINSVTESELALPVSHEDSSSSEVDGFEDEDSEEDKARRSVKRVESLNELEFDENDSKRLFIWRK